MKEFSSFAGLAEHLMKLSIELPVLEHEFLEEACVEIEKLAKDKIGEYQADVGPFGAWPELAESTKEQRVALGYTENDPGLRSGAMRDSIEHKIEPGVGHVGSDDEHLLWFELGTVKQPARSVLGGAAFELEPKIREEIGVGMTLVLSGGSTRMRVK